MKILIVDDSKAMRMIVRRTLRQAGYGDVECLEASDGSDALRQVGETAPDLIMSDWNMPEMTGIDLLKALNDQGVRVKFGFVTSESTGEMKASALDSGASFFITKPFTAEAFQTALQPLLGA
jgi:two-component system chemotaxis response regulator CheY